jgi:HemY protein
MRKLIVALILIALSVALVSLLNENNGYAMFGVGNWTVEGSLAMFVLLDLALFLVLYFGIRTLIRLWSIPDRWKKWRETRQRRRAQNSLSSGLLDMASGKWKSAEQKLIKYADVSDRPILNYLSAARVAQERGVFAKRDSYLKLAQESMPSEQLAVSITQAELQLSNNQMEQALATLTHLRKIAPKHDYVLKLAQELYLRLENWSALKQLLPEISKSDAISKDELKDLEIKIHAGLIQQAVTDVDKDRFSTVWKQVPKHLRNQAEIVETYVQQLLENDRDDEAERLLEKAIEKTWDERLVELYGLIEGERPDKQLNRAESWLKEHKQSPALLLALAHICLRSKLWGKARSYLEASIGASPTIAAQHELGVLLEQMGEKDLAMESYRAGLELTYESTDARSWEYDGRKVQSDGDEKMTPSEVRQPLDAPMPSAGESS